MDRKTLARVHVHATFTTAAPVPLFIAAVEVLQGDLQRGMNVCIPLNGSTAVVCQILSVAPVRNEFGIELSGLVLECVDDTDRELIDCLNIGDETWDVTFGDID